MPFVIISCLSVAGTSPLPNERSGELSGLIRNNEVPRIHNLLDCLRIIFDRILFPFSSSFQAQFFANDWDFKNIRLYYDLAESILNDLTNTGRIFRAAQTIPELTASLDDVVRLPVTGSSVFTPRIAAIVNTNIARTTRLHYQLGQVREVYPGATHSRFEHLLGTCTTAVTFIRALYLNEANTFWRVSATELDINAAILASILHDVGHLALGHFIEELSELMHGFKHENFLIFLLEKCVEMLRAGVEVYDRNETFAHSVFTLKMVDVAELVQVLQRDWGSEDHTDGQNGNKTIKLLERCISIFRSDVEVMTAGNYLFREGTHDNITHILRAIVSGPVDADKLDYLRRDALHCGVLFAGGIDLERFLESLRACVPAGDTNHSWLPGLGVSEKGIAPLETIITARYHLFSSVYWHRTVRCITAMLQRIFRHVRRSVDEEQWEGFFSKTLMNFRMLDDRGALEWLSRELEGLGLLSSPVGRVVERIQAARPTTMSHLVTTTKNLLDALQGDRSEYFRLAFEFDYFAPAHLAATRGKTWREELHEKICAASHVQRSKNRPSTDGVGREFGRELVNLRTSLEEAFENQVRDYGFKAFSLDTILVDVPEPDKDQIRGLLVDRRNKRTVRGAKSGTR